MSKNFKSSVVTITGGTGSFGSTMVKDLLAQDVSEIRIFSRDENKQDSMRNSIKDGRVRFFIGDVRDVASVENVMKGTEYVFHAAALKQVPSCEFFPMQASLTNVTGSSNVLDAAIKAGVKSVVCLSTDKAVYPINAMGMTKALMEKVAQSYARNIAGSSTKIAITR
jgi:UDP-glucose 4-epimerase